MALKALHDDAVNDRLGEAVEVPGQCGIEIVDGDEGKPTVQEVPEFDARRAAPEHPGEEPPTDEVHHAIRGTVRGFEIQGQHSDSAWAGEDGPGASRVPLRQQKGWEQRTQPGEVVVRHPGGILPFRQAHALDGPYPGIVAEELVILRPERGPRGPRSFRLDGGPECFLEGRGLPVGLFNEATYEDHILELPPTFSLTLMSDGILDLLPEPTLNEKEAALPQKVKSAGCSLDGLRQVFGLATLGEMPDDIALLVLGVSHSNDFRAL